MPKFLFSSLSRSVSDFTSNISVSNLPTAYVIKFKHSFSYLLLFNHEKILFKLIAYGRSILQSINLTAITDLSLLARVLPSITKSDLSSIHDDCKRFTSIINLLNASSFYSVKITSNQVDIKSIKLEI